jgi:hypothetical protein
VAVEDAVPPRPALFPLFLALRFSAFAVSAHSQRTERRHSSVKSRTHFRWSVNFLTDVCIYPPVVCTRPLGHSALTPLSHTAHSLPFYPLVCAFPLLNSALTHVHFALNLLRTTVAHSPAVYAHPFRTDTAHSQRTDTAHSRFTLQDHPRRKTTCNRCALP